MKGMIGQRTYYACLMNLSAIPKMFTFQDWIEFRPEDREQRVLNRKRVPEIARYITETMKTLPHEDFDKCLNAWCITNGLWEDRPGYNLFHGGTAYTRP